MNPEPQHFDPNSSIHLSVLARNSILSVPLRILELLLLQFLDANMKIHSSLVLWGVRMGYMSYGWDAGVLGGILETTAFQSAMKVWGSSY
jgi:hypothetical protein